jgi:hypothetical protein
MTPRVKDTYKWLIFFYITFSTYLYRNLGVDLLTPFCCEQHHFSRMGTNSVQVWNCLNLICLENFYRIGQKVVSGEITAIAGIEI